MTLDEIGGLARDYADAREALAEVVEEVRAEQRLALRRRMRAVQARVAHTGAARDRLEAAIDERRDLFVKPRTQSVHGIKFGLRKGPGRLEGDEADAIARIERQFPARAKDLVVVRKALNREALKKLEVRDLAKIGVVLVQDADRIVITAASNDLDKIVEAMLADKEGAS